VYIDYIFIYSKTEEEHIELIRWFLPKLTENNLYINIDKCLFHVLEVEFVGFQVGKHGIQSSQKKVEDIVNWPAPRYVKEVQRFIGFGNFYRRFIQGFSSLTLPIQVLMHNGVMWNWSEQCEKAFVELKGKFTAAPILCHYHPEQKKQIETGASDLCKAGILSQYEPDRRWHHLSYYNKYFLPAELLYDLHDKEMVVVVNCLMGAPEESVVFTYHKNHIYFNTTKLLNRRQARRPEILSQFNFKIVYCPGEKNGKADAQSRLVDHEVEGEGEKQDLTIRMFKPRQFQLGENEEALLTSHVMAVKGSQVEESSWSKEILEAGLLDQHWFCIRTSLKTEQDYPGLQHYGIEDEMVTCERRICILDSNALKLKVAHQCYDTKVAGHLGRDKTLDPVKRNYYWPNMEGWVRDYVRTCDACQRNKTARHKKYGKLVPLEIPSPPWEQISMDFIRDLPNMKGYNQCWVFVDRFTKMAYFIPLKNRKAKELALIFFREVWRLYGLLKRVVSDQDTVFMNSFWSEVMRSLEVELDKLAARQPQTDGQTERVNLILENYLHTYSMWDQDDWVDLLPFAEFCYNNTIHTATFHGVTTGPSKGTCTIQNDPRISYTCLRNTK